MMKTVLPLYAVAILCAKHVCENLVLWYSSGWVYVSWWIVGCSIFLVCTVA